MPMTTANGVDLHYEVEGEGPDTIVLINGLADDLETWVLQMEDFLAQLTRPSSDVVIMLSPSGCPTPIPRLLFSIHRCNPQRG